MLQGKKLIFFVNVVKTPNGPGILITESSRSHSDTPHLVGLVWTSDHPDAETYT